MKKIIGFCWVGFSLLSAWGAGAPLILDWGVVDTSSAIQQAASRSLRSATRAPTVQSLSAQGTAPWLVQFNDVIREEWKTAMTGTGAQLKGYIPENAFLVEATPGQIAAIGALADVSWVGEYLPAYKKSQPVRTLLAKGIAETRAYSVLLFQAGDVERMAQAIADLTGAAVMAASTLPDGGLIRANLSPAQVETVSGWGEVQWIEPYNRPRLWNNVAVQTNKMNVSNVWTVLGLTGAGQTIAVADTGLDTGNTGTLHRDFTNRVTGFGWSNGAYSASYSWADYDAHGSHVCGSVLGNGTMSTGLYKGVAYEANLIIQGTQDDLGGIPTDLSTLFRQAFTNGARVHSDSWGYDDHGYYNDDSRAVDMYIWSNKTMLICIAAGNSGTDSNTPDGVIDLESVASPATAKNCLTVGAGENYRTSGGYTTYTWGTAWPDDYGTVPISTDYLSRAASGVDAMAAFSSRGPCNDGRIKPDIVAPGTDIISTRSRRASGTGWGVAGNTNYIYEGGTSMATPLTAGAAGLTRQWVTTTGGITNPSGQLLKALMLNGARNMAPGQYGTGSKQEIPTVRPNNVEGWGHVDLFHTLQPATNEFLDLYDTNSLSTGQTNTFALTVSATSTNKFILTMAYADYWGTAGSGKQLINDLDLTVVKPGGTTNFANGRMSKDATNNVEMIEFAADETGTYTVRVVGRTVPSGGSQAYALVIRGPTADETPAAPVFGANPGPASTTTGVAVAFTVSASGYPAPTLALQSTTASSGYSFTAGTGQLNYTPPVADGGATKTFTFTATNTEGAVTQTVNVVVYEAAPAAPASIWASATNSTDFTAAWSSVTGATGYRLDAATNSSFSGGGGGGTLIDEDFVDFSDWTDGGTANDTTHYGAASPCRALGAGDTLTSPGVDYPTQMTFYVDASSGGSGTTTTNYYSLDGGGVWLPIGSFTVSSAGATETQVLTSSPNLSGSTNVMFRFVSAFNTWYLDDVKVTGGGGGAPSYVAGYSNKTVAGTSQSVTGLTSGATYYFRARAVSGGGTGAYSSVASVTTTVSSVAPTFGANPGPVATTSGVAVAFTVSASGSPTPTLALQSQTATSGYSFTPGTGQLSYTPPQADGGATKTFTFTASNSAGVATQTVSVAVTAGTAPAFTGGAGPYATTTGVAVAFTVTASGTPAATLALKSTTASTGYSFTPGTGQLSYTPPTNDIGTPTFTFTASNVAGVVTQVTSVAVSDLPATAPQFGPNPGPVSTTTGVAVAFTVATTNGSPTPTLALKSTTASSGYSFTPGTGQLNYTPPEADAGARTFTFTASNNAGVATQVVSVSVTAGIPSAPASIWASATNATDFTAAWSSVLNATGYRLDVGTNATFTGGGGAGGQSVLASNAATISAITNDGWSGFALGGTSYVQMTNSASVITSAVFSTVGFTNLTVDFRGRTYNGGSKSNITVSISTNNGSAWTVMGVVYPTSSTMGAMPTLTNTANLGYGQTRIRWQSLDAGSGIGVGVTNLVVQGWSGGSSTPAYVPGYSNRTVAGTSQSVTGLVEGATYYFRARAVNGAGTSVHSGVASVLTAASGSITNIFEQWLQDDQGQSPEDPDYAPDADHDLDGATTWEEFLADTDPNQFNSVLVLTGRYTIATTEGGTGAMRLQFPASPNRYYQLEYCTDITNHASVGTTNLGWGVPGMAITNDSSGTWYGVIRVLLQDPAAP